MQPRPAVDRPDLVSQSIAAQGLTALRGSYSGLAITAMAGQILGLTVLGPAALAVGMAIGTKTVRDDRRRQLSNRQATAKQAVRSYLDDVQLEWSKDVRDRLRRVARELRDHFTTEARELAEQPDESPEPVTTEQLEALRVRIDRLRATREERRG